MILDTTILNGAATEQRLRALLDSNLNGLLLHDAGFVLAINRTGASLFGQRSNDMTYTHLSDWVHADSQAQVTRLLTGGLTGAAVLRVCNKEHDLLLELVPGGWLRFGGRRVQIVLLRDAGNARRDTLTDNDALALTGAGKASHAGKR